MQQAMNLEDVLREVIRQNAVKQDFVTSTRDNIRIVIDPNETVQSLDGKTANPVLKVVLLKEGASELERFGITEHAHRQIAERCEIPWKVYNRFTHDHPDLIEHTINALFEREPQSRLIRVLDGNVRAFLSNKYRALDNQEVLEMVLPPITQDPTLPTQILGGNVNENRMDLKVLFQADHLAQNITNQTRTGASRIVQPGFRLSNSEVGGGALKFEAFFYDSYCLNGCVFGKKEGFSFARNHIGGKLIEGVDYQVVSDETRKLQDQTIIAEVRDGIKAISDPVFVDQMGNHLRSAAASDPLTSPIAAVEMAVKELGIKEIEKDSIITTLLQDGDLSKFGLASAVTSVANNPELANLDRVNELEDIGAKILDFGVAQWGQFTKAAPELVAA